VYGGKPKFGSCKLLHIPSALIVMSQSLIADLLIQFAVTCNGKEKKLHSGQN
jgi:hypothetical protein